MNERPLMLIAEAIGKFVLMFGWLIAVFFLYVLLANVRFGIQIATVVVYSGSVFLLVFFRWKYLDDAYSLRNKAVQDQIPRLLAIHLGFLCFVIAVLSFALFQRFPFGQMLACVLAGFAEVFISRNILSHRTGIG